jgi:hypothetical protein
MTKSQSQAIWELCRQGLHLPANEAERNWDHGKPYWLDRYLQVPRRLTALIDRCNWEITSGARSP